VGKKKEENSRGSGKWDDAVTKRADPRDAQLGDCDTLTVCYGPQVVHELKVVSDVLGFGSNVSRVIGKRRMIGPYIILETAICASEIAFFKVVTTLDLTGEQSTTEWAVLCQKGVYDRDRSAHE
jgi:hypothetical protein